MTRNAGFTIIFISVINILAIGAPDDKPPIVEVRKVKTQPAAFKAASAKKPIVLKTAKDAAKYFAKDQLANLEKTVDFKKQTLLVFAWRGSGQDRIKHAVAESNPEQITFTLKPGRTRDLRPHVHLYALRSNVKWVVAEVGRKE